MAGRPFARLNSSEQLYHSPSPSQQFDIGVHPISGSTTGRNADYETDYFTYMSNQQQQQQEGLGLQNPFAARGPSYQPVGQYQDGEKKPLPNRTYTETSNHSRISSISSRTSRIISPLLTKSWHHGKDKHGEHGTVRVFSRARQARKTLVHGLVQWLPPVIFSACMALIIYIFSSKEKIKHSEKYLFNAFLLGFTLLLGFSVQSTFKLYADLMRWRFLASSHWDLKTFERIMGSSSQRTVLKLLWSGRNRGSWVPSRVQLVCFVYLFFAIGLQVVIACIGLCYSVESSQRFFFWTDGPTTISDLSKIELVPPPANLTEFESFVLQSGAANTWGLASTAFAVKNNFSQEETNSGATIYAEQDAARFEYRFLSYCSSPDCDIWRSTKRSIATNATCKQIEITNNGGHLDQTNVTYIDDDGNSTWFDFGYVVTGGTTTYASDMDETCGPRCASLIILNTAPEIAYTKEHPEYVPQLFKCNSTVGEVQNIDDHPMINRTLYSLPDLQARILAGAIGYSGSYWDGLTYQLRNYAFRTHWSWDNEPKTEDDMAHYVAQFSIGAIAAIDQSAPRITTFGSRPSRALTVSVKWMWTILVLVAVPGVQLLFLFYVMWFTRGVVIRDGSFLGNARLLRPIADELGEKGCALSGDEIAEALESVRIAYGVRIPANDNVQTGYSHGLSTGPLMHLDIIQPGETHRTHPLDGWQPGKHMPEGRYDGYEESDQASTLLASSSAFKQQDTLSVQKQQRRRQSF